MSKLRLSDYQRLERTLELAGLKDKQVAHILRELEYVVSNAVFDAKEKAEAGRPVREEVEV